MKALVLIGHGGVPEDFSREKVRRLVTLETERQRMGTPMSDEEKTLDDEIRNWPRNELNDPFESGMKKVAMSLEQKLEGRKLVVAYNEFCGPSIEAATEKLISEGFANIEYLSTMFTPGGVHSEFEIPEIIESLKAKYPNVTFDYKWPYDLNLVSDLLSAQLASS